MRLLLNDSDSSADISLIYLPFLDYKDVEVLLEVESSNKGVCSLSEFLFFEVLLVIPEDLCTYPIISGEISNNGHRF